MQEILNKICLLVGFMMAWGSYATGLASPMTARQELMQFFYNPNLLYILLLLGILGILMEIQFPGLIFPGLIGVLLLGIVFGVQILPINWFAALLILGAAVLFVAEIFISSFGLLGLLGFVLLIAGSYSLFSVEGSHFGVEPLLIWLLSAGLLLIMVMIGLVLWRSRRQRRSANVDGLVGQTALVVEAIDPPLSGRVLLHGSYWRASAQENIAQGMEVVVSKVDSTKLLVRKKKE